MADRLNQEKRSWNMSRIRSKDTSIEVKVRRWLFHKGFRYRKNVKELPGKPDIVFGRQKIAIFVHGCFWHRHSGCSLTTTPKSREDYWANKFQRNIENDQLNCEKLLGLGWKVIVIWECEIKDDSRFLKKMKDVENELKIYPVNSDVKGRRVIKDATSC